jgi:hypothetical protein
VTHVLRTARSLRGLAAVTAASIVAALLAAPPGYASSVQPVISAATGGRQMTAANAGPSAAYASVGDSSVSEFLGGAGLVSTGRFTLKVSAGFEFGTTPVSLVLSGNPAGMRQAVSLAESCTSTSQSGLTLTPTVDAITFYICAVSTAPSSLGIKGMAVRPTANAPVASGNIYLDNSAGAVTISGYNGLLVNFGTLIQNPGATTQLAVALPASATAGAAQSVIVTAQDAYGNATPAYRGTVHVTSTDPAATLPPDYTFTAADAGVHAFTTPVFNTAGTRSLTVTDMSTSVTGVGTTTVVAAPASTMSLIVLSPSTSSVTAGAGMAFTAQARDSSDNNLGDVTAGTTFTIAPNGSCSGAVCVATVAGPHTIIGTNSGATGAASLTVTPAAPMLSLLLTPDTLVADGAATSTALIQVADQYGNPRAADPVSLKTNGDATISAVHDNGDGSYTATVTASRLASTQTLTASVGAASTTAQLVQRAPLSVTRVSPDRRGQGADGGASGQSITVTGTGFTVGALPDFGPGVTVKSTTYTDASHLIAQVVVAPDATVGTRSVTVTAADGRSATCAGCFTVTAAPSITDVSPNQISPGAKATVTITGANFAPGVKVTVSASGTAITSTTVRNSTTLLVGLSAASGASPGPRDLTITNPADGGSTICRGCFTVTGPPVVAEVSPAVLGGGAQITVTVTGANFAAGARLSVVGTGVTVLTQNGVDAAHLTATLSVAAAATAGVRTITVTNPNGGKGSCATCFAVATAPTVTGLTPATFARGSTTAVTITGTGFQPGATVSLSTGVSVQNVVVVDTATITATVAVSATAGTGNRTLVVTNPNFGKGTCPGCAKVTYPFPR